MDARPSRKRVASAAAKPAAKKARRSPIQYQKETGYVDLAASTYNCDTTGTITLIATIPQGTSVNQRVGKKVMLKSVQFRGLIRAKAATTTADAAFLIIYDARPTGALPAITDVLDTATAASFNNDTNSDRFRILKRRDFTVCGNVTTPSTGQEAKTADFFLKINKPSVFKAAGTGAIADISDGALYLVTVGNQAAGTGACELAGGFRTRYIDV